MTISLYQASVPVFVRALKNLAHVLRKGESHAEDSASLLELQLAPDMHPLTRQVQIACDIAKGGGARLADLAVPSFPDTETTFAELQARIEKTIAFLDAIHAAQIDGGEDRTIVLKIPTGEMNFTGQSFLLIFSLPNLFFHVTAAYAILRHAGVPLGKMDYIAGGG